MKFYLNMQNIAINSSSYIVIMSYSMFMLPMAQHQHPYLNLGENMNFALNDDFRFWNFVLLNQKFKKQKWQCSQNLDLNPTYGISKGPFTRTVSVTVTVKLLTLCQWNGPFHGENGFCTPFACQTVCFHWHNANNLTVTVTETVRVNGP